MEAMRFSCSCFYFGFWGLEASEAMRLILVMERSWSNQSDPRDIGSSFSAFSVGWFHQKERTTIIHINDCEERPGN